jgi:hypothetical protein
MEPEVSNTSMISIGWLQAEVGQFQVLTEKLLEEGSEVEMRLGKSIIFPLEYTALQG